MIEISLVFKKSHTATVMEFIVNQVDRTVEMLCGRSVTSEC